MADFLMEFRRGHCTDAPFPLHREKMVMGMDMDMDMGIAMVMVMVGYIDKWVKSKFDNETPPELCSGPT